MTDVYTQVRRRWRLGALAFLAALIGACNGADNLTSNTIPESSDTPPTVSGTADSLTGDSVSPLSQAALQAETYMFSQSGMAFGPTNFWSSYTTLKSTSLPFSGSVNFTSASGIIQQINAARNMRHRLVLNMTGGSHSRYKTNGRFDLSKWKAVMNTYNRSDIRAAVAKGVSDGTVIMNSVMDEPNVKDWGGVVTKSMLDGMARYVKNIFPTLVVGVTSRYDWRQSERFRVMDAYITAYKATKGPVADFRSKVLANAKAQGMKVMFAMNVLDGGYQLKGCPLTKTGGYGTYYPNCRMSAGQVRDWGRYLGPAGCAGLMLWQYDRAFMTKSANVSAFRDVASTLRGTPGRTCRRG
jgi:hypothetical protein